MSEVDIASHKAAARKAAFAARALAHDMDLDFDANAQLYMFLQHQPRELIVAFYHPIRTEISPVPAMEKLAKLGRSVCLPVVKGSGKPLEFREWVLGRELIEAEYGAKIPVEGDTLEPDVIITPLAAFDREGYRLGYGGGFYDRSFAELSEKKRVQAVGYAYSDQELMMVPREETDYRLDAVITEHGLLSFD